MYAVNTSTTKGDNFKISIPPVPTHLSQRHKKSDSGASWTWKWRASWSSRCFSPTSLSTATRTSWAKTRSCTNRTRTSPWGTSIETAAAAGGPGSASRSSSTLRAAFADSFRSGPEICGVKGSSENFIVRTTYCTYVLVDKDYRVCWCAI